MTSTYIFVRKVLTEYAFSLLVTSCWVLRYQLKKLIIDEMKFRTHVGVEMRSFGLTKRARALRQVYTYTKRVPTKKNEIETAWSNETKRKEIMG